MWKLLLNLILIIQLSVNSVPIDSVREIKLECESKDENPYVEILNCYFLDISSSNEQLNVTSMNIDMAEIEKVIHVNIFGNVNYPEYFPKNLSKLIRDTYMFKYNETPLRYVTRSDFADMSSYLSYFDLEDNEIDEIPYDLFYDMDHVRDIRLSHNNIKSLPPNLFKNSLKLETFHIEFNKIKEFHPDLFKDCPKFATLRADFNDVEELHEDLFKHNPKMSSIWFRNNKIRNIGVDFEKLKKLDSAVFLHNQGSCGAMYLGYRPTDEYYSKKEMDVLFRTVPEFQEKIEEVCK